MIIGIGIDIVELERIKKAMKALNLGEKGAVWKEIEIRRQNGERPEIFLTGVCKKVADELGVKKIFLSMSHNKTAAISQIILTSN